MKRILKIIGLILLIPLLYVVGCILYAHFTFYQPEDVEALHENQDATAIQDTILSVGIWNIGYGGLGKDMDFFYDEGERTRPKKEWHQEYIEEIKQYLKRNKATDFMLLQEVDEKSKRSYKTNEKLEIKAITGYTQSDFALNYKVNYIPIPLTNPLGNVKSGLQSLTNHKSASSNRYQLPGSYGFPDRLFFLRRCFLEQRFNLANREEQLIIINTHNSAYDDGTLKEQEMTFLKEYLLEEYNKGNFIVVGGDWNQYLPDSGEENTISADYLPDWTWAAGADVPTNRGLNKPYDGTNTKKIIDFFLLSPNVSLIQVETIDLDFQWSDHQPVFLDFALGEYNVEDQVVEDVH